MYLGLTAFVEIEKKWLGLGIKDASIGLKLKGNMDFSLELSIDGELRFVILTLFKVFYACVKQKLCI